MWITKDGSREQSKEPVKKPAASSRPGGHTRELHVSDRVEGEISAFLIQQGRLEMRIGKHLMQFTGITRNGDGSVDYLVRTRMHTQSGMQRNFESHVRILADGRLKLIR
jgi:hypothetical protein